MKKGINNNKISFSTGKNINNFKIQKSQNILSNKEKNKINKKPLISNSNQDKIKETKYQTESKSKIKYIKNNQYNNSKEIKIESKSNNIKKGVNENRSNILEKNEEIIEKKDATIIISKNNDNNKNVNSKIENNNNGKEINEDNKNNNNDKKINEDNQNINIDEKINDNDNKENNNKIEDIKEEEKNKYLYLQLSKEQIDKLLNLNKPCIEKPLKSDNIQENNINFIDNNKLKILKKREKSLFNEVDKINLQRKYINECSFNNLSQNNIFHKNLQNNTIKNLIESENNIFQKLNAISQEIDNINNKKNNNNILKEENKENFRINIINKKYKDLIMENNIIFNKIKSDAELCLEKRIKELDLIEKEENKRKSLELKEKIKIEKMLEKKRKKQINIKVTKNKPFINCKNIGGQKKNYLYFKMATSFDKKEEKLIKNHKIMKPKLKDDNEEKNEILRKNYLEKKKKEKEEKTNNLHIMWKERNDLLPKYKSPLYEKILYSEENIKEKEKNKIENKKRLYNAKEKYGKEKISLPPISNILRRENIIKRKNSNLSIGNLKNFLNKNKSDKNNFILNNSKESKLKKSYSSPSIKSSNKANNQKGKIIISISKNKNKFHNNKNPNDFNYLEDLRKERLLKNKNEIYNIKNININSNIDFVKGKIQLMEEKYKRDKELLKIKGGYANNQELGDKMNELLVNSIKNKLDIIENMNKNEKLN